VASLGASRCPHSSQKIRWPGLFLPHVVQITQAGWDNGRPSTVNAFRQRASWASRANSNPTKCAMPESCDNVLESTKACR